MAGVKRDIIVVGASAGGIKALTALVGGLPQDLGAAVLIVLHMGPSFPDGFAQQLTALGALPVTTAVDKESIMLNRVYLCVPNRHLLIEGDAIRLTQGPKENHSRPSIDALFRSAAYHCGPRAIGVVLTGHLDDGTAGLWAIKDRGGLAVIQDPAEALDPSMPMSARQHVDIDYTLKAADMGAALVSMTHEVIVVNSPASGPRKLEVETSIAMGASALDAGVKELGDPLSVYMP